MLQMNNHIFLCQINDVDGETHAQGVHTATGNDPQPTTLQETGRGLPSRPHSRVQWVPAVAMRVARYWRRVRLNA